MTDGIVLDGYLDEEVAADDTVGTRARFRLIVSPTDELVDEMVLPCSVADSELTNAVLNELRPGDHVRVTGYLGLPRISGHPMWLQVLTLELLGTLPLDPADDDADNQADAGDTTAADAGPVTPSSDTLSDVGRLERYGQYIVWSDPDLCADTVWTKSGELLGTAVYPDTCTDLIDTHQRRAYGDA
ncbi:hypothetical protein [Actinacidiphila paucisporea]|uniref:Uncharacterized protein n=1 Tax=Actinacidiphila paucisporea TaxID=310782 RepID=A0A1M7QST6_9ACTN|nr:hypothetical protein [Actinacidiphila paucisporea]SHN34471.1 hypothetical protein SAMN05216499_14123 [Actinacidiphila paucisporea]